MEVEKCIWNVKWIFLDNYKSCRDLDLTPACSPLVGKFWRNQKQLPFSIWFDKEDGDSEANRGSFNQSLEEIRQIGSQKILERDLPAVKIGGRGDKIWGRFSLLQEAILILQSVLRNRDAHLQLLLLHLLRLHRHHRDVPLLSLPAASDYNNTSDKINFQEGCAQNLSASLFV